MGPLREKEGRKQAQRELLEATRNTSSSSNLSGDATLVSERERELSSSLEIALNELEKRRCSPLPCSPTRSLWLTVQGIACLPK